MNGVLREYIFAVLAAIVFFSIVIGAVVGNQAKTQKKKTDIQAACGGSGGFVSSVCKYKSGGGRRKSSGISLPSEPFRGIDTGIPY